jgi:hypothetical protein
MTASVNRLLRPLRLVSLAFAIVPLAGVACGSADGDLFGSRGGGVGGLDDGRGGTAPSGGTAPKAGSGSSAGGALSQGGSGSGGRAGSGGSSAKGGAPATGGVGTGGTGGIVAPGNGGMPAAASGAGGVAGCVVDGKSYRPGDATPSRDCNTCRCTAGGIECTMIACATGGAPNFASCDDARAALADELASIQSCNNDEECGQVLEGTSCGCTRDLVARLDANPALVKTLLRAEVDGEPCIANGSTCDCPAADGFACKNDRCTWNYTSQGPACDEKPPGRVCIRGTPVASGERLTVGSELMLTVTPADGCYSSSCTRVDVATCSVVNDNGDFVVNANFCLADTSGSVNGCTDDCGGGGVAECSSTTLLTKGQHTLRVGDHSLQFEVPSILASADACLEL